MEQLALFSDECVLSVIIVSHRRAKSLESLYRSLEASFAQAPFAYFEVITVVNGPDAELASVERKWTARGGWQFVRLAAAITPPEARNEAIRRANGKWLLFLDDDVILPEHYFSTLFRHLKTTDSSVVGGPNLNPYDSSDFERVTGLVLGSALVTGPFAARYSKRGRIHKVSNDCEFILCNLAIRHSESVRFPSDMPVGEENALLLELNYKQMLFLPELFVFHRRRPDAFGFAKQMLKYGQGRGLLLKRYGFKAASNSRLLVVSALLLGCLLTHFKLTLAVYLLGLMLTAFTIARGEERRLKSFLYAITASLICHLFYPIGCLRGWLGLDVSLFFSPKPADKKSELSTESHVL